MRQSEFGTTVFEQVPREFNGGKNRNHFPWAMAIVILVVILFGTFWFYEQRTNELLAPSTQEIVIPATEDMSVAPAPNEQGVSIGDLQAAAVNTAIPDFSKEF